jgi:hypothetical protein
MSALSSVTGHFKRNWKWYTAAAIGSVVTGGGAVFVAVGTTYLASLTSLEIGLIVAGAAVTPCVLAGTARGIKQGCSSDATTSETVVSIKALGSTDALLDPEKTERFTAATATGGGSNPVTPGAASTPGRPGASIASPIVGSGTVVIRIPVPASPSINSNAGSSVASSAGDGGNHVIGSQPIHHYAPTSAYTYKSKQRASERVSSMMVAPDLANPRQHVNHDRI